MMINIDPGIEVYPGCMFSGKTEKLAYLLNRIEVHNNKTRAGTKIHYKLFRPGSDTRVERQIDGAILAPRGSDILKHVDVLDQVIAIDEAQFFDASIVPTVKTLVRFGKLVLIAGLDLTFEEKPFGSMGELMCLATKIEKLPAVCTGCGRQAFRSQRIVASRDEVLIGSADAYEARCMKCFVPPSEEADVAERGLADQGAWPV